MLCSLAFGEDIRCLIHGGGRTLVHSARTLTDLYIPFVDETNKGWLCFPVITCVLGLVHRHLCIPLVYITRESVGSLLVRETPRQTRVNR
jgi:hypothetical protein